MDTLRLGDTGLDSAGFDWSVQLVFEVGRMIIKPLIDDGRL